VCVVIARCVDPSAAATQNRSAFPPGELDSGYGAPLSKMGERVLAFAAQLGFDALQLGPSGQVSPANLSPYDGTIFARNTWSLGVEELADEAFGALLSPAILERLASKAPVSTRVDAQRAERVSREVLDASYARLCQLRKSEPQHRLLRELDRFRSENAAWLEMNAVYEAIATRTIDDPAQFDPALIALFERGPAGVQRRAAVRATLGAAIERSELGQYLCHAQHAAFRARARTHGLAIWGDMQVGFSHRDRFLYRDAFAANWRLGAPPSRTNPHGQPWGYPLLDPDQLDRADSPARQLFALRVRKLMGEHDGVRIDHPHGLVCPWIYRSSDPDPYQSVRHGARAFESSDSDDPDLRRWAIARNEDLNPAAHSKFADERVLSLDDAQVARYSRLFDVLTGAHEPGVELRDVFAAEVLSTCPYPLQRVLERHALGRFRVTQKANPSDAGDVYRTEHAEPNDWLMLGTHDTPPVYEVARGWLRDGSAQPRAAYLAQRLVSAAGDRAAAAASFAAGEHSLLCASLADLFRSRAHNVSIFVGDLFGETEPFNRAGVVHPDNWTARLPENLEETYMERLRAGRALDIVEALRLALASA
jgi:4-alpha-glucanotransferase